MNIHKQHIIVAPSNRETSEAILKRFDWYIIAQANHFIHCHSAFAHQAVLDLEIDELIQRARIKFWRALEKSHILYPHAYIKRIIHSEFIDMRRQQKLLLPLPTDEDEEGYQFEIR